MKMALRVLVFMTAFAGILTVSTPNYASPIEANPGLEISPKFSFYGLVHLSGMVPKMFNLKSNFEGGKIQKKKEAVNDHYSHAWKVARYLASSA